MKTHLLAATLLVSCILTAAPRSVAQSALLDALPADSMAVLAADDIDALKESLAESAMGKLWHDAALDAVREELSNMMGVADGEALDQTGVSPFELLSMVHGGACMAVVAYEPQPEETGGEINAAAAWMFDTGEDLDAFSEGFDRFIDWFVETEGIVFKTESYGDIDVAVMVRPEDEEVEIRYGFVESVLLITAENIELGRDVFGEIVDGLRGKADAGFAQDSGYPESVAAAPSAGIRLWVDLGEFLRRAWDAEGVDGQAEIGLDMEQMGFTKLGAMAAGMEFSASGSNVTAALDFMGRGWCQDVLLAGVGQQQPAMTQWMPDSATSTYAMDLDLGAMFDEFLGLTMEQDPEDARNMIADMAEMEADIGFHLRDDLLDNMDGQLGFFISEVPMGEGIPMGPGDVGPINYAMLMGLADGEAMAAMLDGLVRSQGLHAARQLHEFEGYTMYVMPFFGMNASYAVLDDLLVLSLAPSLVKDVLRRKSNPELPSLLNEDDVKRRSALLPEDKTVLSCQDAAAQMTGAFEGFAALPFLLDSMEMDMGEDFAFLGLVDALSDVDPSVVEKYYRDTYSLNSITVSERGLLMVSSGP